jgi:hypothetical protein
MPEAHQIICMQTKQRKSNVRNAYFPGKRKHAPHNSGTSFTEEKAHNFHKEPT